MATKRWAFLNTRTGRIDVHREHCSDIGLMRHRGLNSDWLTEAATVDVAVAENREQFEAEGISGLVFHIAPCARKAARS